MRQLYKLLCLSLTILCAIGCTEYRGDAHTDQKEQPSVVDWSDTPAALATATLHFRGDSGSSVSLHYQDYLHSFNHLLLAPGTDSVTVTFRNFLVIRNSYRNNVPFIVLPNDRIEISMDTSGHLVLETHDPVRNSELSIFSRMLLETRTGFGPFSLFPIAAEDGFAGRDSLLRERIHLKAAFLEQYAEGHSLRPEVYRLTAEFLKHESYFDTALLLRTKGDSKKGDYKSTLVGYLQEQTSFSYYFPEFRITASMVMNSLRFGSESPETNFEGRYALLESHFDSSLVASLQFMMLRNQEHQKLKSYDKHYRDYIRQYPGTDFSDFLRKEYAFQKATSRHYAGTQLLGQADDSSLSLEAMVAGKRGKVLYVDFWASWCTPCLREIPYSIALKKKYEGAEVEFLYISMDKVKSDWAKGQGKHPQVFKSENSFLMLQNFSSPFAENFKLQSIPRYMLIDRKGKIVNSNAPRPSEGEALDQALSTLLY